MLQFETRKTPSVKVQIDGKSYEAQANTTYVLYVQDLQTQIERYSELADTLSAEQAIEFVNMIAEKTKEIVTSTLGDKAYEDIMAWHELDLIRIVDVMQILAAIYSSDEMETALAQSTSVAGEGLTTADNA